MMCSACGEDHEPICDYCGQSCFGRCDDPDTCPHCFYEVVMMRGLDLDDWEDERFEAQNMCFKVGCNCQCHDEYKEDLGMRYEAGGLLVEAQDGPPFERQGVFPLLELPGEIREKIYGFSFLQDGEQRKSSYHRGTIHTNLLRTCRQVYNEAGHLPLTLNKLSFGAPFLAHDFLGFGLAPTQRHLMTGLNIEFYMMEFSNPSWRPLMRELSKMHITHLGLTVKGGFPKEAVDEHPCFANRFKGLKELKTFNLILGSGEIKPAAKMDLQEEMRERLIKGYVRPKDCKTSNTKRTANTETDPSPKKPSKKAKRGDSMIKNQAKLVRSPKPSRFGNRYSKPERDAAQAAKERAKQSMHDQLEQLRRYAITIDSDAGPVKIRLARAREAAEELDEKKFEKLAHGILMTLEDLYNKISAARKDLSRFPTPCPSHEPESSQACSQASSAATGSHDLSQQ